MRIDLLNLIFINWFFSSFFFLLTIIGFLFKLEGDKTAKINLEFYKVTDFNKNLFYVLMYILIIFFPSLLAINLIGQEIDLTLVYANIIGNQINLLKYIIIFIELSVIYILLYKNNFLIREFLKLHIILGNLRDVKQNLMLEQKSKLDEINGKLDEQYPIYKKYKFLHENKENTFTLYESFYRFGFTRKRPKDLLITLFITPLNLYLENKIVKFIEQNTEFKDNRYHWIDVEYVDRTKYKFPINLYLWLHNDIIYKIINNKVVLFFSDYFILIHVPLFLTLYDIIYNNGKIYYIFWYLPLWIIFLHWENILRERKIVGSEQKKALYSLYSQLESSFSLQILLFKLYYIYPFDKSNQNAIIMTKEIYEKYVITVLKNNLLLPPPNGHLMDNIRQVKTTYVIEDAYELDILCVGQRYMDKLEGSNLWIIEAAYELFFYEDENGVLFDFCVTLSDFEEFLETLSDLGEFKNNKENFLKLIRKHPSEYQILYKERGYNKNFFIEEN